MKASISDNDLNGPVGTTCKPSEAARQRGPTNTMIARRARAAVREEFVSDPAAFTLIELLVVIATMAVLAGLVLPALAGTQAQSKTTACTARFRQWAASANLYANDNRGWLPTADPAGGAAFAWDMGTSFPGMLSPYGMDITDWFCPMLPAALDNANAWARTIYGHPIQNVTELRNFWSRSFPQECSMQGCCCYWVPRYNGTVRPPNARLFPPDYSHLAFPPTFILNGKPTCLTYGWPQRLHDVAVPYVPFVSDAAGSGNGAGLARPISGLVGSNVTNMSPNTAHFINGTLIGVNLAFADGHVVNHTPDQMRAVYNDNANFWFY